jgi:prepilin-type N-terminal cleavage/methylation domain-containing protein
MKKPMPTIANRPSRAERESPARGPSAGFTLVEMLVVISIIGILAALVVPATMTAVRHAKVSAISVEINQLETACKTYQEKFGEYPPDFLAAQATVLQHLAKAFPRYQPGVSMNWVGNYTGWTGLLADISNGWFPGMGPDYLAQPQNQSVLSPTSALLFWLGGQPDWKRDSRGNPILPSSTNISNGTFSTQNPVRGFLGFSANPLNPFDNSASRIPAFMDFNVSRCGWLNFDGANAGLAYWAQGTEGSKISDPVVYFRAENGNYTTDGGPALPASGNLKYLRTQRCNGNVCALIRVWPAIDSRLSNTTASPPVYSWVNSSSIQIFSAGLGKKYGDLSKPLIYPSGANYASDTFGNIANFSGGTLESMIP